MGMLEWSKCGSGLQGGNIQSFFKKSFGCAGSSLLLQLSSSCCEGGYSSLWCAVRGVILLIVILLLLQSMGSRVCRLQQLQCSTWAQQLQLLDSKAQAQQLWCTGLVTLWHIGSSHIRDQTNVSELANGFFTTELPGKPQPLVLLSDTEHKGKRTEVHLGGC